MTEGDDQVFKDLIQTWRRKAGNYLEAAEELEDEGEKNSEEYLLNVECAKVLEACAGDLQRLLAGDLSKASR